MNETKKELMRAVKADVVNGTSLPLYTERIKNKVFPVIGEGNHDAKIMFVGEAPGRNEAATGRPFCGAAGTVLDELLASVAIPRADVYITNIVKDRPHQNRDPLPLELESYSPFLDRQIDIIQPKVIATLGRFSMAYILEHFCGDDFPETISKIHGKVFTGTASYGKISVVPLYHPAVAIYNPSTKEVIKEDFKVLKTLC
ncbi:MAG: uracil-DNA glycosylase [Patescibacteria group bacterium]